VKSIGLARARPIAMKLACSLADARQVALGAHPDLPINTFAGNQLRWVVGSHAGAFHFGRSVCRHCCTVPRWGVWCLRTNNNGHLIATLRCVVCGGELATTGATESAALPVWADANHKIPCEHCGEKNGVEFHHWAPRHLFDDADAWPTAWLCVKCHQLWHRVVTPNMSHRKAA
jgi:hypothetical protein